MLNHLNQVDQLNLSNLSMKTLDKIKYRPSLLIVLGIILVLTMVVQLTFLSFFGTRGSEVAHIRSQQKEYILENELLEAEISKKQSLVYIKKAAEDELGMITAGDIEYLSPKTTLSQR